MKIRINLRENWEEYPHQVEATIIDPTTKEETFSFTGTMGPESDCKGRPIPGEYYIYTQTRPPERGYLLRIDGKLYRVKRTFEYFSFQEAHRYWKIEIEEIE